LELGPVFVVSAKKKSRFTRVGLYLKQSRQQPGVILIADIDVRGLFGYSALQVGQRVLSINGAPCPTLGAEAVKLISDCKGKLTIEVVDFDDTSPPPPPPAPKLNAVVGQGVLAFCYKSSKETCVGLSLRKSKEIGAILIVKISDQGLFHDSKCGLRVGQKLVSINGNPSPKSTAAAIQLIRQAKGKLMIEAAEINWGATISGAYECAPPPECDSPITEEFRLMADSRRIVGDEEHDDHADQSHLTSPVNDLAFLEELERDLVQEMNEIREHVSLATLSQVGVALVSNMTIQI
jgi:hypothetical protein